MIEIEYAQWHLRLKTEQKADRRFWKEGRRTSKAIRDAYKICHNFLDPRSDNNLTLEDCKRAESVAERCAWRRDRAYRKLKSVEVKDL